MAVMFQVEVNYFDENEERVDKVEVKEQDLPTWLRAMASDIEQEGLKVCEMTVTVCGLLAPV